jgi:hypothetical protein
MWFFIIILVLMIPLLAVVLDSQLGRALAARLERDNLPRPDSALGSRVEALEAEVDRLNSTVAQVQEDSQFTRRLLESRPAEGSQLPPGDRNKS